MTARIRVLIVDDSALMRRLLESVLASDPDIEVVGTAPDPLVAREKIKQLNPDVLTLDVEMPRMDGLAFLEKVMTLRPMPVVMVSSLTGPGAEATLRALELGAVDVFCKPGTSVGGWVAQGRDLIEKVKAASTARVRPLPRPAPGPRIPSPAVACTGGGVVAIGSSTGGVEALRQILTSLPPNAPPIVMAQHIPARFSASFAQRVDAAAAIRVKEAEDGDRLLPGLALIAPGERHLTVRRQGSDFIAQVDDGPLVGGHKPSVNVLFQSVAAACGNRAIGIILTGMGRDGAEGLLAMRRAGATTIGQDEASCVVYGMPKAARELGAVEKELPLPFIAEEILRICQAASKGPAT